MLLVASHSNSPRTAYSVEVIDWLAPRTLGIQLVSASISGHLRLLLLGLPCASGVMRAGAGARVCWEGPPWGMYVRVMLPLAPPAPRATWKKSREKQFLLGKEYCYLLDHRECEDHK